MPVIIAGLRVATVSSISLVSVGQLIGIGGLGYFFIDGEQRDFPTEIYTALILIIILALLANTVLVLLRRWLTPGKPGARRARAPALSASPGGALVPETPHERPCRRLRDELSCRRLRDELSCRRLRHELSCRRRAMSYFQIAWQWLTSAQQWQGPDGIPVRLAQHLVYTGIALGIAVIIALPAGLAMGHLRRGGFAVVTLANFGRALPTLGLLVLIFVLTSGSPASWLVPLAFLAIPPILVNTYEGVLGVDHWLTDAARGMGMTEWQVLRKVEIPVATPLILLGLRISAIQVVATATIAAYIGLGGLGRTRSTASPVTNTTWWPGEPPSSPARARHPGAVHTAQMAHCPVALRRQAPRPSARCRRGRRTRRARAEAVERQVQHRGAHLAADAATLVRPAEPRAGADRARDREVARGDALRADDVAVGEHDEVDRPGLGREGRALAPVVLEHAARQLGGRRVASTAP